MLPQKKKAIAFHYASLKESGLSPIHAAVYAGVTVVTAENYLNKILREGDGRRNEVAAGGIAAIGLAHIRGAIGYHYRDLNCEQIAIIEMEVKAIMETLRAKKEGLQKA